MNNSFQVISHRGNLNGPNPEQENQPSYIDLAINKGYTVETDIHYVKGDFYLGHDYPAVRVTPPWLKIRKKYLILHCKDLDCLFLLKDEYHCFWHQNDDYTLTSNNLIWTYPNKKVGPSCVIVDNDLPTKAKVETWRNNLIYGVCTDYAQDLFKLF